MTYISFLLLDDTNKFYDMVVLFELR